MRRAMIGWGRDRHLSALDRLAQEIAFRRPRSDDDDDEASRVARRDRRLAAVATARTFVARALSLLPAEDAAPLADLARATRTFVAEFGRVRDELDGTAGAALAKLLMELESLPGRDVPLESAAGRLAEAVRSLHFAPERPRPGRIHFADFRAGGFSGRSHTFVVGLDEKRHPGQGHEDPVLSDEERRGISELSSVTLALAPDRSAESARALRACVSRLRGNVSFGYAGWTLRDLLNPGEVFPSPFLLEAFRARGGGDRGGGSAGADYGDLSLATGEGEGFVPDASRALDETEWWLARIGDRRGQEAEGAVAMLHPWLADGLEAEEARSSPVWTRWDGVFTAPTPELDPRASSRPMSASRIQMLAECPFGYFLRHVLRLAPPDEPEDRGKGITWLDPRGIGSLIHRVFRRFLEALAAKGRRPSHPADLAALEAVAEEELAAMRLRVPPRSELAFSRRRDDVLFACRTFLLSEAARASEAEPIAFEVAFGTSRIDEERAPEFPDPVEIALPRGRSFRLRGSIDRVDRDSAGRYHVWDYKTGSAFFVHEEQGISAGRQIQPALYALAWESLQAGQGKTEARVATSGFFFPGKRGLGERFAIAYSVDETRQTLDTLFDLLAAGAFPHTPDKDSDCFACKELVRFCPNNEEAGKTSKTKFDSLGPLAPALAAWKKLRDE
jgi:ATP-dependent helicase/nuclease subunit B